MKRFLILGGVSLLVLIGILAGAVYGSARIANANASSTTASNVTVSTNSDSTSAASSTSSTYCSQFQSDLAKKLGVSPDKLKSSESSAASDTIDQMVKDGKLTQAKADQIKAQLANATDCQFQGMGGGSGNGSGFSGAGAMGKYQKYLVGAEAQVAKGLGISSTDLTSQLQSGKSLHEIATAHKISDTQLKTLLNNAIQSELKAAVSAGDLTQAQADMFTKQLSNNPMFFDRLINGTSGQLGGNGQSSFPTGTGF